MEHEPNEALGIAELAAEADVTPRTVRYYVAEGLLPPPGGAGQQRTYGREHLLRLRAIKRLKEAYLPLGEIRECLAGLSAAEVERLAEGPAPPLTSASEYLGAVLSAPARQRTDEGNREHRYQLAGRSSTPIAAAAAPVRPLTAERLMTAAPASPAPAATTWRRVVLAPGVELHYQPSADPRRASLIEALILEAIERLANVSPPRDPRS